MWGILDILYNYLSWKYLVGLLVVYYSRTICDIAKIAYRYSIAEDKIAYILSDDMAALFSKYVGIDKTTYTMVMNAALATTRAAIRAKQHGPSRQDAGEPVEDAESVDDVD